MRVLTLQPAGMPQEWTPFAARVMGLRYIIEQESVAFSEMVRAAPLMNEKQAYLDALLVNLHEPLFTYPVVNARLQVIGGIGGRRILDYGCGAGYYAIGLALAGHEVACWDSNPRALDCVDFVARRLGLLATRGPLRGTFDAALCINMLDHTSEPELCLDVIEQALAPSMPLFLHADFHGDGVHVSGKDAIDRAFRALAIRFAPGDDVGNSLQVWRKRGSPAESGDGLIVEPARLGDSQSRFRISDLVCLEQLEDGGLMVTGKVFYIRTCQLAPAAARILLACDGTSTVGEISRCMKRLAMSPADVRSVIAGLWVRRLVVAAGMAP